MSEIDYKGVVEILDTGTSGNRLALKVRKFDVWVVVDPEDPSSVELSIDGEVYTLARVDDTSGDSDND